MILAAPGRHAEAWPCLERMPPTQTRDRFHWTFQDQVRDTPEFAALIDKLGIAEECRKAREAVARIRKNGVGENWFQAPSHSEPFCACCPGSSRPASVDDMMRITKLM